MRPELVVAAALSVDQPRPDRALLERAAAGREAVDRGADPALVLSLVVWPTEAILEAASASSPIGPTGYAGSTLRMPA